ncbi:hypothetical protein H6796_00685 [Candidatus Nomurabacteria bacterium]|nr:hypothetical protein [Candidatus Nomurabacteria bacterium]
MEVYSEESPIKVLNNGEIRHYDVYCGEAMNESGDCITIRKDSMVDHRRPDDWMASITSDDKVIELPLRAAEIHRVQHHKDGDFIVLTADKDSATPYQGPLTVRFGVNDNYQISGPVEMGYPSARDRNDHGLPAMSNNLVFYPAPTEISTDDTAQHALSL